MEIVNALIGIFSNLFNALKTWVQDLILYIVSFVLQGFNQVLSWALDLITWVLDKISLLFSGLDVSGAWSGVPAQTIHVLYQLNILTLISIIVTSIMIRSLLNLIPSWASRI